MTTGLSLAAALWVFVGVLVGLSIGFVLAKNRYRKKYKQEHSNVLNCVTFWPRTSKGNDRLHVFAVATHETDELRRLVKSFNEVGGVPIEIIGLGCKWQGFGNKPLWLREKILQMGLGSTDIVLFVDAYDVLCIRNLSDVCGAFQAFGKRLIFGAERGCHPDATLADRFPRSPSSFTYTNSGGFIGYADEIVRMVDWADPKPHEDDQLLACKYTLENPETVGLDYNASIFLNLFDVSFDEIEISPAQSAPILVKETGYRPHITHGNGPAKAMLKELGDRASTAT